MTDRELMQMALDALEEAADHIGCPDDDDAIGVTRKALRARLAQPEPEPVVWADKYDIEREGHDFWVSRQQPAKNGVPLYTAPPQQPERKLWLWKNFVDGRPEYWAFDNPYPTNLDNGDPQTLGQPCGYAIFKPSRDGSCGRTEEQVLREMESVSARSERDEAPAKAVEWQGLTENDFGIWREPAIGILRWAEAVLKERNK